MKNTIKYLALILSISLALSSCTDVIDVDVPNGGARFVVEASINWEKGTVGNNQTIKLSTSTPYFSDNINDPVTGATVEVVNNSNNTSFSFTDQNNGEYTTSNFVPILNQSYTLNIEYNGQTYSASETLLPVSSINRVEQKTENFLGEDQIQVRVYFDDPAGEENCYIGEFKSSNEALTTLLAYRDEFTDGKENFILYSDEDLKKGNIVDINFYGVSRRYFNYMNRLIWQSGSGGGMFQVTPVQLKGNCKNINNPDEEVLGYFKLSQYVHENYTIK